MVRAATGPTCSCRWTVNGVTCALSGVVLCQAGQPLPAMPLGPETTAMNPTCWPIDRLTVELLFFQRLPNSEPIAKLLSGHFTALGLIK